MELNNINDNTTIGWRIKGTLEKGSLADDLTEAAEGMKRMLQQGEYEVRRRFLYIVRQASQQKAKRWMEQSPGAVYQVLDEGDEGTLSASDIKALWLKTVRHYGVKELLNLPRINGLVGKLTGLEKERYVECIGCWLIIRYQGEVLVKAATVVEAPEHQNGSRLLPRLRVEHADQLHLLARAGYRVAYRGSKETEWTWLGRRSYPVVGQFDVAGIVAIMHPKADYALTGGEDE